MKAKIKTLYLILIIGVILILTISGCQEGKVETKNELVKNLCMEELGELKTPDDYQIMFRGIAQSVIKCENNQFKVSEIGYFVESSTILINSEGRLLDVCQGLFRPEGCERMAKISCESIDLCKDFKLNCNEYVSREILSQEDCDYLNSLRK